MKSEEKIKHKPSANFTLNSHSNLIQNQSFHPAFKLTESIYTTAKSNFFENLNSLEKLHKSFSPVKPTSQTPVPKRYYKDPNYKSKKEDVFLNPSAIYLSKKPIAFNKYSRDNQRGKNASMMTPIKSPDHKKTNSSYISPIKIKLPKVNNCRLVPIEDIKAVSPRSCANQSQQAKEIHCEALSQISSLCENIRSQPPIRLDKEKKILHKYSEKMSWITNVLQDYGEHDYFILKELFKYSEDSSNDLEWERANIVHLMKIGVFDPNKNAVKLRVRIKKNREKFA